MNTKLLFIKSPFAYNVNYPNQQKAYMKVFKISSDVSEELHQKIKCFCALNGISIRELVITSVLRVMSVLEKEPKNDE